MVKGKMGVFPLILAIIFSLRATNVFADMSSTNYQIKWDEVSSGGGISSSATYGLRDSVGTDAAVQSSSSSYVVAQGFRAGVFDPVVGFTPYVQNRSTQVGASTFNHTSLPETNSVTVTSTSGFSVGDYILVAQDEGASQVSLMARVTSVSSIPPELGLGNDYSGTIPTVDGSNDYVYKMDSGTSMGLGTISSSIVATDTVGWVATSDVANGYSVYMFSGGELTSGSANISGVSDGAVTAGSTEYGGRASDASLASSTFDTQDTAFTTSPAMVASESAHPFVKSGFVTLKASVSSAQDSGTYTQSLTAIFVGEY